MTYQLPVGITDYIDSLDDLAHERLLTQPLVAHTAALLYDDGFEHLIREGRELSGCLIGVARGVPNAAFASLYMGGSVQQIQLFMTAGQIEGLKGDIVFSQFDDECDMFGTPVVEQAIRDYIVQLRLNRAPVPEPAMVVAV